MRVEEIMNSSVKTIKASGSADAAWEQMRANGINHLVVVDASGVVGVVSERDLGGRQGVAVRKNRTVADVMTAQPVTTKPGDTVRQAANLMRGRGIGSLPVMDGNKLKGIITVTDLLELIGRGLEKPLGRKERAILSREHGVRPKKTLKQKG